MPTDNHERPDKAWLWKTAALAGCLGLGTWLLLSFMMPRAVPEDFPKLPDMQAQNAELRGLLGDADAEARRHPGTPSAAGRLGMIYHSNQFYGQAESAYRIASRLAPGDYRWTYCRALMQEENGQETALLDLLKETVEQRHDFTPALQKLADLFFKQDRLEEAAKYYERGIRAAGQGSSLQAAFGLGRVAARREDWARVIEILAPLAREYPQVRPPHQLLADAYEALGQPEKAAEERTNLIRSGLIVVPPIKDPLSDELLELCCTSTRLLKQAEFLGRFGYSEQQLQLARRAVRVQPDDPDAQHFLSRTLLKTQGADPKAVDEALFHLNEGLRLRPDDFRPAFAVADIFFSQNKTDAAIEQLRALLARDSASAEACYYLGVATESQGKLSEAVEHYRDALKKNPEYAEPCLKLGVILAGQGKIDQAIEQFEKAVHLKPTFDLAFYNLGLALAQQGKLDQALESFQKVIVLKPGFAPAYHRMGLVLEQRGRIADAIAQYAEAVRLEPSDGDAHLTLGLALAQTGKLGEAEQHIREALRITPGDADAHCGLGSVLLGQGKVAEAAEEFRQTLRLQPDHPEARRQLQKLERSRP